MRPAHRRWLGLMGVAALGYGAAAVAAFLWADSLLFCPQYASRGEAPEAFRLRGSPTLTVPAVYLPNPEARFTLWHFHGNAESLADVFPRLQAMRALGFAVFAVEYPGYGASEGAPTESAVYEANQAGLRFLREQLHVTAERLVLHGRSLGGGPATELAAQVPVAGLILESAFVSAYRVMTRWPLLPGDRFENLGKLARVRCPVLVIHGRADEVVPFWHGAALFDAAHEPKQRLWVEDAGHNDLSAVAGETYPRALTDFAAGLTTIRAE